MDEAVGVRRRRLIRLQETRGIPLALCGLFCEDPESRSLLGVTVPADCEIDACGVLAVGRCATCGLAFCTSHRGISSAVGRPIAVNQCLRCVDSVARRDSAAFEAAKRALIEQNRALVRSRDPNYQPPP